MICPNCGVKNNTDSDQCPHCGIFYIKWIIRQHKAKSEDAKQAPPQKIRSLLHRIPKQLKRKRWIAALIFGIAIGLILPDKHSSPKPSGWYHPKKIEWDSFEEETSGIYTEVSQRAKNLNIRVSPADLQAYFTQGANSFNLENLRATARTTGELRPIQRGTPLEHDQHEEKKLKPVKCSIQGTWKYFRSPPGEAAGARECWSLSTIMKRETIWDNAYWEVSWHKLKWAPSKNRWAYFTREDDRALFKAYIASFLDYKTERLDAPESLEKIHAAQGNPSQLKAALLTAFRTRLRRAGALYRLKNLTE